MSERPHAQTPARVRAVTSAGHALRSDVLATEEPLEIRVQNAGQEHTVAITMRTPGADFDLAAGFLYGEGVVSSRGEVHAIRYCQDPVVQQFNVVTVDLPFMPDLGGLDRHFYTTSACGVCGKASLDQIAEIGGPDIAAGPVLDASTVLSLPRALQESQKIFAKTGGLHAAALFDASGRLLDVREDVGRHNAMDKLIGVSLLAGALPLADRVVLVSGRASFELLQKARRAGVSFFCSVSAPSSLAVDVAKQFGMTLVGFLRDESFNVYAGDERIAR